MASLVLLKSRLFFCSPSLSCSSASSSHTSKHKPTPTPLSLPLPMSRFLHLSFASKLCLALPLALVSSSSSLSSSPSPFIARSMSSNASADASSLEQVVRSRNEENPVVVYSKTWCPYCGSVKSLFNELGVKPVIVELDELAEELAIQQALNKITGQSTVPNVFIGGKHIGGCDDTMELHQNGELVPLLEKAGLKVS